MLTADILLSTDRHNRFSSSTHARLHPFPSSSEQPKRSPSSTLRTVNGPSFFDTLVDKDQQLSAELKPCVEVQMDSASTSTTIPQNNRFTIPISTSQPVALASSPAAQFLSAFRSPPPSYAPLPDDKGQNVAGYTLDSVIGYGGFSTIRRAYSASGGIVAVKIVRSSDIAKQPNPSQAKHRLSHETVVWSSLSHEHTLPLFSAVHTSYADYFITLYCPAGSLFDILKRDGRPALPHDDAGMMFRQVVRGLRYIHECAGYVHRDMKLENVLVDEMGVCRIGDFGMSCRIGEIEEDDDDEEQVPPTSNGGVHRAASMALPISKRLAVPNVTRHGSIRHRNSTSSSHPKVFNPGSLPYAAPELLSPRLTPLAPDPSQDIWALGVMLYALLTGRLPFSDSFEPRLQLKIINAVYELPSDIGRGAQRVLGGCLDRKAEERWTITMVDEVAWGVGWGSEGDDLAEEETEGDEAALLQSVRTSRSCSQARSYPATEPFDPDSPSVEESSRPHQEAASRRSNSRFKRSLSRAPALTDRSSSTSKSRRRHSRAPSPSLRGLESATLSSGTLSGSSCYSPLYESRFIVSPTSPPERGRRRTKPNALILSRSPSPSVVPSTPVDAGTRYRGSMEPGNMAEKSKPETHLHRRSRSRDLLHHPHFMPDDVPIPETEVLEGRVKDWQAANLEDNDYSRDVSADGRQSYMFLGPQRDSSYPHHQEARASSVGWRISDGEDNVSPGSTSIRRQSDANRGKRAESSPPTSAHTALLPSWAVPENRGRKPLASIVTASSGEERFLTPSTALTPTALLQKTLSQVPRSKSVGHGRFEREFYMSPRHRQAIHVEPMIR
ncbi:hypothetical protein AX15_000019 [Amanita polypyramis BW_CC]|nr:hypothetical protein AX15_000019 [Amanita polypyramis BW_CC]